MPTLIVQHTTAEKIAAFGTWGLFYVGLALMVFPEVHQTGFKVLSTGLIGTLTTGVPAMIRAGQSESSP